MPYLNSYQWIGYEWIDCAISFVSLFKSLCPQLLDIILYYPNWYALAVWQRTLWSHRVACYRGCLCNSETDLMLWYENWSVYMGRSGGGGSRGSEPPFLAHVVGFLTLGLKLAPLLPPPLFLLVDLSWTPLFSKILDPPLVYKASRTRNLDIEFAAFIIHWR